MKRKLIVRPRAEFDLLQHCVYLADHHPQAALRLRQATETAFEAIRSRPRSGATLNLPTFAEIELRFQKPRGFKAYLVIYQVTVDSVVILRVLHGSQDIESALRP
jgi:plasmid stabilization system protein ParE